MTTPHVTELGHDAHRAFNTYATTRAVGIRITRWHLTPAETATLKAYTGQTATLLGHPVA